MRRLSRNKPTDIFAAIDSAMEEQQASHILRLNVDMKSLDVDEVNSRSKRLEISEEKFDVLTSSMLQIKELQKQLTQVKVKLTRNIHMVHETKGPPVIQETRHPININKANQIRVVKQTGWAY